MYTKLSLHRLTSLLKISFGTLALLALTSGLAQAADASGTWKWSFTTQNGDTITSTAKLKQEGNKLTGTYVGRGGTETQIEEGAIKDDQVSFKITRERDGQKFTLKYRGKLAGNSIVGKMDFERDGETTSRDWEAKREGSTAGATGNWKWSFTTDDGEKIDFTLKLKEESNKLTGVSISPNGSETEIAEGKTKGDDLSFKVSRERDGRTIVAKFRGKRSGDTITGKIESDFSGENRTYDWTAKRAKE